jgi:hypothetical protein
MTYTLKTKDWENNVKMGHREIGCENGKWMEDVRMGGGWRM